MPNVLHGDYRVHVKLKLYPVISMEEMELHKFQKILKSNILNDEQFTQQVVRAMIR